MTRPSDAPNPMISVSSPGKVILFGEHAVVHGTTAIAASVSLRTRLNLVARTDSVVVLDLPDIGLHRKSFTIAGSRPVSDDNCNDAVDKAVAGQLDQSLVDWCVEKYAMQFPAESPARSAVLSFWYLNSVFSASRLSRAGGGCNHDGMEIQVSSDLPVGAGLGSSASFSVCIAAALLRHYGLLLSPNTIQLVGRPIDEDLKLINRWAFIAEKVIHGTPSGIDNTVSTYGGAKAYRRPDAMRSLPDFGGMDFLLVDTGVSRNTRRQVENVTERLRKYPLVIKPLLDSIEQISVQFEQLISTAAKIDDKQQAVIEDLIDINHSLLNGLGVGHEALDRIRQLAADFGLHAKLTGAGGGGCALVYLPHRSSGSNNSANVARVCQAFNSEGFRYFQVTVGGSGVEFHE